MRIFGRRQPEDEDLEYGYLLDLAVLDLGLALLGDADDAGVGAAIDARLDRMYRQWPVVTRRPKRLGREVTRLPRPAELDERTCGHLVVDAALAEPFEHPRMALTPEQRRAGLRVLATRLGFESSFADRVLQTIDHASRAVTPPPPDLRRRALLKVATKARAVVGRVPEPKLRPRDRELVRSLARAVLVDAELCSDPRTGDRLRVTLAEERAAAQEHLRRLRETECPPAEIREAEDAERALGSALDWLVRQR